jgi:hypothetical protein
LRETKNKTKEVRPKTKKRYKDIGKMTDRGAKSMKNRTGTDGFKRRVPISFSLVFGLE